MSPVNGDFDSPIKSIHARPQGAGYPRQKLMKCYTGHDVMNSVEIHGCNDRIDL